MVSVSKLEIFDFIALLPSKMKVQYKIDKAYNNFFGEGYDKKTLKRRITVIVNEANNLKKNNPYGSEVFQNWGKDILWEASESEAQPQSQGGRPRKRLSEQMCSKTQGKILDSILETLEKHSEEQNIGKKELLNLLIKKAQNKWKDECTEIVAKSRAVEKDVPIPDACALMLNLNLSINQYQLLRLYLLPFGISLPTRNKCSDHKKTLLPSQNEIQREAVKTSVSLQTLVYQTIASLLKEDSSIDVGTIKNIAVLGKMGVDGSGSHQIRHQLAEEVVEEEQQDCKSYLGAFWCPLKVKVDGKEFWKNNSPNSLFLARPIFLVRAKENRESIKEHFKPAIDQAHALENAIWLV